MPDGGNVNNASGDVDLLTLQEILETCHNWFIAIQKNLEISEE